MGDILSQDEINALLSATEADDGGGESSEYGGLPPVMPDPPSPRPNRGITKDIYAPFVPTYGSSEFGTLTAWFTRVAPTRWRIEFGR